MREPREHFLVIDDIRTYQEARNSMENKRPVNLFGSEYFIMQLIFRSAQDAYQDGCFECKALLREAISFGGSI